MPSRFTNQTVYAKLYFRNGAFRIGGNVLNLYSATCRVVRGLGCDCCILVSKCTANVFARNEKDARKLIRAVDASADIRHIRLKNRGRIKKVKKEGVQIVSSEEISKGPAHSR